MMLINHTFVTKNRFKCVNDFADLLDNFYNGICCDLKMHCDKKHEKSLWICQNLLRKQMKKLAHVWVGLVEFNKDTKLIEHKKVGCLIKLLMDKDSRIIKKVYASLKERRY